MTASWRLGDPPLPKPLLALVPAHMDTHDCWEIGTSFECLASALRATGYHSDDIREWPSAAEVLDLSLLPKTATIAWFSTGPVEDPSAEAQRDADRWHGRG